MHAKEPVHGLIGLIKSSQLRLLGLVLFEPLLSNSLSPASVVAAVSLVEPSCRRHADNIVIKSKINNSREVL